MFYFGENFFKWRRKKFTRVCQVLLEDDKVFACEESFIRKLEKLLQETINCWRKVQKVVHVGMKS